MNILANLHAFQCSVAKFLVSDWGDSGIGFSYRPARLNRLADRYYKSTAKVDNIARSVTKNLASVLTGTYDDITKTTMSYHYFVNAFVVSSVFGHKP
jgi:hypothetical protein